MSHQPVPDFSSAAHVQPEERGSAAQSDTDQAHCGDNEFGSHEGIFSTFAGTVFRLQVAGH
jgi:hypothetical protein